MPANSEAMDKDAPRLMLESERSELLLILVLRIHDSDRFRIGSCAGNGFLETADAEIYEDGSLCHDEYDYVVGYCYDSEGDVSAIVHGHYRSTSVFTIPTAIEVMLTLCSIQPGTTRPMGLVSAVLFHNGLAN